jgi:hypothetical protein
MRCTVLLSVAACLDGVNGNLGNNPPRGRDRA